MNPLDKLEAASFKGFPFPVEDEKEPNRGRKIAIHDYPNSDKRYGQDLGLLPSTFDVVAVIHGPRFKFLSTQFKNVLDSEGVGQLVLPHLGTLEVKALPYSVDYSHKAIGVVRFRLKFTISNADEVPAQAPSAPSDVYQSGDFLRSLSQERFVANFEPPSSIENFLTAAADIRSAVVDTVVDATATVNQVNSKLQKIVRDVQTDLTKLIRDPLALAQKLVYGNIALANGLLSTVSSLYSGVLDTFDFFADIFDGDDDAAVRKPSASEATTQTNFGKDWVDNGATPSENEIVLWEADTAERIQRNNNRTLIVETVRVNSLILGLETAANFDYTTSEEIADTIELIEGLYSEIILTDNPTSIYARDDEFVRNLDIMRTQCYDVLDQKAQKTYTVSETRVNSLTSVVNLAYQLYAEDMTSVEDMEGIAKNLSQLNPNTNPSAYSRDVKIFEVG